MIIKRKTKWQDTLCRVEQRYPALYAHIGMTNMHKLIPRFRLKFWAGMAKIMGVGYIAAMFTSGTLCIISLLIMNVLLGWWFYKWKCYLASLD